MWIAGVLVSALAVFGLAAIVRAIPASYANIPNGRDALSDAAQTELVITKTALARERGASCSECGVVVSMRQIESRLAGDSRGGASNEVVPRAARANGHEITVRFRDGSTTVFNDASPRNWRLGTRVIVIGRSSAAL